MNNNLTFYNAFQSQEELNKIKSVENKKLYSLKQNKKRNISEIFNYIIDKIGQNQKSINLLYDLIILSSEHLPVVFEKYEDFITNNSEKLKFIKTYVKNKIIEIEINKNKNIGVINHQYKILIQILKSVYRIQFNESTNEEYSLQKNRLLIFINTLKNKNENNNYSRNALSDNNLENALRNVASSRTMNKSDYNRIVRSQNSNYMRKISANDLKDTVSNTDKVIAYTSILSNPPPSNNMEGFHNFTRIEYFIYNKKLCGELTEYNDLIEKSPLYYANGLFHINPKIKEYYTELKEGLAKDHEFIKVIKTETIKEKNKKNPTAKVFNIDELINNIDLLNNSRILSKIFEQNFIYNVEFKSSEFKSRFYTVCEEFNFQIDTICIGDNFNNNFKISNSYTIGPLSPFEKTRRVFSKPPPIFKIKNLKEIKGSSNRLGQKGGEIITISAITCTIGAIFCVAFFCSSVSCYINRGIKMNNTENNKQSFSMYKCIFVNTLNMFWGISGSIIIIVISFAGIPFTFGHSFQLLGLLPVLWGSLDMYSKDKLKKNSPKYIEKIELTSHLDETYVIINFNKENDKTSINNVELLNFNDDLKKKVLGQNIIKSIFEDLLKNQNKLVNINKYIINICYDLLMKLEFWSYYMKIKYFDNNSNGDKLFRKMEITNIFHLTSPSLKKYLDCKEFYALKLLFLKKFSEKVVTNNGYKKSLEYQIKKLEKSYESSNLKLCTANNYVEL